MLKIKFLFHIWLINFLINSQNVIKIARTELLNYSSFNSLIVNFKQLTHENSPSRCLLAATKLESKVSFFPFA